MDPSEPGWQLLDDFFAKEASGRAEATVRRYGRVRDRLTQFLDTGEMSPWLGTHPGTLLSAEREFHDNGAFWQLFGPDELVCVLPGFLLEPWLPESLPMQKQSSWTSSPGWSATICRSGAGSGRSGPAGAA